MFVFDRSAFAVLLPLALLVAVVLWSNLGAPRVAPAAGLAGPVERVERVDRVDRVDRVEPVERVAADALDAQPLAANLASR
ncbi:MAG TPA: hypothetical protein VMF52_15350 [Steroidobacteraceae bacterium]|nr:hypothetical protein [Steroidobacteraceae bacterium]